MTILERVQSVERNTPETSHPNGDLAAARIFEAWLAKFGAAVQSRNANAVIRLFHPLGFWKDILAFTWEHRAFSGIEEIHRVFAATCDAVQASDFCPAVERAPPSFVERSGQLLVEGYFEFRTTIGCCVGFVRLLQDDASTVGPVAWLVMTSLHALHGFADKTGTRRPTGDQFSKIETPHNWSQLREVEQSFADKDPEVIIVGAGHSGLMLAARLRQMGASVLLIEKAKRVGDGWRSRYNSLTLHNPITANEFPYLQYPSTWPVWIPKDMLGDWLESYARLLELNVWTDTTVETARFDEGQKEWQITLTRDGETGRKILCKHLVAAVGVSGGVPRRPALKGLSDFEGDIIHSGEFKSGAAWSAKRALVIGTGNSGHDIAQDLYVNGASVTVMQRGATCVITLDPGAMVNYAVYFEGRSIEDADLMNLAIPYPHRVEGAKKTTARTNELDKEFLTKLEAAGFKTYQGTDGTGFTLLYARGNGGYYINVGCSDLIIDRKIDVLQAEDVETFVAEGLRRTNGTTVAFDLVVLATGFEGMQENIRRAVGDEIADRVGPIWGFDGEYLMRNMWRRTRQPNFWIMGGSITEARPYSRFLALEIKASLLGLLPETGALPLDHSRGSTTSGETDLRVAEAPAE